LRQEDFKQGPPPPPTATTTTPVAALAMLSLLAFLWIVAVWQEKELSQIEADLQKNLSRLKHAKKELVVCVPDYVHAAAAVTVSYSPSCLFLPWQHLKIQRTSIEGHLEAEKDTAEGVEEHTRQHIKKIIGMDTHASRCLPSLCILLHTLRKNHRATAVNGQQRKAMAVANIELIWGIHHPMHAVNLGRIVIHKPQHGSSKVVQVDRASACQRLPNLTRKNHRQVIVALMEGARGITT
jgi:hypothetical protein